MRQRGSTPGRRQSACSVIALGEPGLAERLGAVATLVFVKI